jgi:hypothetical protein
MHYSHASNSLRNARPTSSSTGRDHILVFNWRNLFPRPPLLVGVKITSLSSCAMPTHLAKFANASYDWTPAAFCHGVGAPH